MIKFCYTISIFQLQSFLSKEWKDLGFEKVDFFYTKDISYGNLYFSQSITDEILNCLKKDGIHFVNVCPTYKNKCSIDFIHVDGCYYNILESDYQHNENPFSIKTFTYESENFTIPHESAECPTTLMIRNSKFIHITGLDDEIFLEVKQDFCQICSKPKKVLGIIDKCNICLSCVIDILK
jgi:hypothetical protein